MTGENRVGRLLLRAPNWLGDAVLAIPAMAAVRAAYSESHLTVAAPLSVAPLFREHTSISPDSVLELPAAHRASRAVLTGGRFDACVLFPNSFRTAWDARKAGIPERWGFSAAGRGWLLTRAIRRPAAKPPLHQSEYYNSLVRGLGISADSETPGRASMTASEASLQAADTLLRQHRWPAGAKFVAIMPGAAYGQAKQWLPDRMAEVAARLVRELGLRCVILGAASDRSASRAIESWLRTRTPEEASRVLDVAGQTSLGVLVGLLSRAEMCVSNDSGGMHVAAALGRPVVAIFGPTDERVTRPIGNHVVITEPVFCRPCMLRDCPIDHRCMKRITTDRVFEAASSCLVAVGAA